MYEKYEAIGRGFESLQTTPSNGPHSPKDNNLNDQRYEQCRRKKKSRNQSKTYVSN